VNVLAIDQSYTNSGIALFKNGEETYTSIAPPKVLDGVFRLIYIRDAVSKMLETEKVSFCVFEDYAFSSPNRAHLSGELGGMLRLLCFDKKIPFLAMPIGTHKKFTTGKGNTKKDLMLKEVYKKYEIDLSNDNIADAVSILKTFLGYLIAKGELEGSVSKEQQKDVLKLESKIVKY
jgi:crossover junction endodeoxyribonuclease RuvC